MIADLTIVADGGRVDLWRREATGEYKALHGALRAACHEHALFGGPISIQ